MGKAITVRDLVSEEALRQGIKIEDKYFWTRLEQAATENHFKVIPKVDLPKEALSVLRNVVENYGGREDLKLVDAPYLFFLVCLLGKEGSAQSAAVIEKYAATVDAGSRSSIRTALATLGSSAHIRDLVEKFGAESAKLFAALDVIVLLKNLGIEVPQNSAKPWSRQILVAKGAAPAYPGAKYQGVMFRWDIEPYLLRSPWKISLKDQVRGSTYISSVYGESTSMTQNDLNISAPPKNLSDLPIWLGSIAKQLETEFTFDHLKIFGSGRMKKEEAEKMKSWLAKA